MQSTIDDPADAAAIRAVALLLAETPGTALTGAGLSTDSGIPDYRGAGTPPRTPLRIDQFLHDEQYRRRFWAGAAVNARTMPDVAPNPGHRALARLQQSGFLNGVATQNVDDLHRLAGSDPVVELHGNGSRIRCTDCSFRLSRTEALARFEEANPGYALAQVESAAVGADGDAIVTGYEDTTVPGCPRCGGVLRPEVVYFGEFVPPEIFREAESLVGAAGSLLVAGTSLAVNTGIRLVNRARKRGLPIIVINRGPTAIDRLATIRIEGGTSEYLAAIQRELSGDDEAGHSAR